MADWQPTTEDSPFSRIGSVDAVQALAEEFYEEMFRTEPALTAVHDRDADGRVKKERRDRFSLFLVGWLGGPQDYTKEHGHPRLRQRHAHAPIDSAMRDAWMRCMVKAMETRGIAPEVRAFLTPRFADVADFLRNTPDR